MAYILKTIGESANVPIKYFECDNTNDLYMIDVTDVLMGSTCYVIHTNTLYTLNGNKEWKIRSVNSGNSGNSGGGGGSFDGSSVSSIYVVHGNQNTKLSDIIDNYILSIDYDVLDFDTTEIVVDINSTTNSTSILGQAILGQMVLA